MDSRASELGYRHALLGACLVTIPATAFAQSEPASDTSGRLEDIVVTPRQLYPQPDVTNQRRLASGPSFGPAFLVECYGFGRLYGLDATFKW